MKTSIENESKNVVKVDVEIPAKDGLDAYNRTIKTYASRLNIPGFRKGKAPRNIIERQVGKERIIADALEYLLPSAFQQVIRDNKLDILTQPKVNDYNFEIGKDIKVSATIELKPEVVLKEYKNMKVTAEEYVEPKDAFDAAINNILNQSSTLELVVDRNTVKDDVIVFDFDGYSNGEKIEHGDAKNYTMDLANSNFIPGFAEQLIDKPLETEFDVNVTFPENYHEAKLAGQPAVFKCVIHEIKTRVVPELTDELAQKVGPFKTVDDLKADVRKYLDSQKEVEDKKRAEKAILDKIFEETEIEIHDAMIKRESDSLLAEYKQKLRMQGFTWEQAIEQQSLDKIMESINSDALFRIKNSLIIDKIAKEENLFVDQKTLSDKIRSLSAAYQMDNDTFTKYMLQNPNMINGISQQALNEKVIAFLTENNEVSFKKSKKKV